MNRIQIRPVTGAIQTRQVAELAYDIWHQHFTPIIGTKQVDYMLDKFQSFDAIRAQIRDGYRYYLLYFEGQEAGYSGVKPEDGALFLSKLYILQDYRGKRIASKVMQFYEDLCHKEGLKKIWLTCNRDNTDTLAVYKKIGFEIIETKVADIGGGYVMDDYILEKQIR